MNSKDSERKHQGLNVEWVEKQMTNRPDTLEKSNCKWH